jgi:hypothetical protein
LDAWRWSPLPEAAACSTYRGTGVAEQAITADLGSSLGYLATPLAGHLAAGEKASFAFTLRESELASTASGSVYLGLIVEGSGGLLPLLPVLPGLTAVASSVQGNRAFALYKLDRAGLKLIEIGATSAGSYQLSLFVAGDANRDGKADGSDAVLIAAAAGLRSGDAGYALALDADANGVIDSLDLQLLMQNTGFTPNQAPVVVAATVTTHEDLDVSAPVASFVTDPEGDRSFFSIVGASHGTARLSGDGRAVIFAPEMGFVGSADFTIRADDGFGQTIQTIAVTISNAALTRIDFVERVLRLDVGEGRQISLIGDFADQSGVELPVSYVSLSSSNVASGTIASGGRISAVGKGSGVLVAERGELRAATSFTVGTPTETVAAYVFAVGLDVYPGAVALTENGGRRQIVASLAGQIDLTPASSGTRYFVSDDRVLSVSADGLITGKAAGSATVTVINGGGEFVLSAMVEAPISGPALLGSRGGIVEGADGSVVAVAAGALTGNTQVSIAALAPAALPLAMPEEHAPWPAPSGSNSATDKLATPVQLAIPTTGLAAGTQVVFMRYAEVPTPEGTLAAGLAAGGDRHRRRGRHGAHLVAALCRRRDLGRLYCRCRPGSQLRAGARADLRHFPVGDQRRRLVVRDAFVTGRRRHRRRGFLADLGLSS